MGKKIKKAVFPVAGLGTRFLPATKASPKEMLPVVDKPLIQYAAEEAVSAGIDVLIFVTGRSKRAIPDHFDKAYELECELEARDKVKLLSVAREVLPSNVCCVYIRQAEALGLGHAVLCARPVVGDEPFAVILADDLIDAGENSCMKQMVDIYNKNQCSVIGVQNVTKEEVSSYGIVDGDSVERGLWGVNGLMEKPRPEDSPSTIAIVGRYILEPSIFRYLESTERGSGGEIQLTDGIAKQLEDEKVMAYEFVGKRFDCGSKLGYLQANVEYALKHKELDNEFRSYLNSLVTSGMIN
jgi:UTP--glucose-1-phosphate uridylyltransferase